VFYIVSVNSIKSGRSVASLHALPFHSMIRQSPRVINEVNPRCCKDTNFNSFLEYISSCEPKRKNFLDSRKG
jgi:hypothetical protein